MAETVLGFFLENLARLISQEVDLLSGIADEVKSLQGQIKLSDIYLRSFGGKSNEQEIISEFISQARDLIHEAEDVIDTYAIKKRSENALEKMASKFFRWKTCREVASRIVSIQERFNTLYENRDRFGMNSSGQLDLEEDDLSQPNSVLTSDDAFIVGMDDKVEKIIAQLVGGNSPLDVIPIVGMGGIGKTTLAKKVYNDLAVTNHFDIRAWVTVSQKYRIRELMLSLFKSIANPVDLGEKTDEDLKLELKKILRSTRYLIVLDDVWKTELWDQLKDTVYNKQHGSRIILTTRINDVGMYAKQVSPLFEVDFFTDEQSWGLLSRKVFGEKSCPPSLIDIGRQIAMRCGGLPLAIVVLAGVLLKKGKTPRLWSRTLASVPSSIKEDAKCQNILELSYNHLPHHLKQCFLYIGIFPEDYEISAKHVTKLWLAEGFVQGKDKLTAEEVAEQYLDELVDRNLIQVNERKFDGSVKSCRIHDLLRDLCMSKAKKEKFLEVYGSGTSPTQSNSRRLGIHHDTLGYISSPQSSKLRSLLSFGLDDKNMSPKHWKSIVSSYNLLRVLDLWSLSVDLIPEDIDKLFFLRYMRLKSHTARTLPSSICNLGNLEILEIKAPLIDRPLVNIWKMRHLRHFYFNGQALLPEPPRNIENYDNLQTLSSISPDSCRESVFSKLRMLIKLGVYGDLDNCHNLVFKHLAMLKSLRKLKLIKERNYNYRNTDRKGQAGNKMDGVHQEPMASLPDKAKFPENITKITLSETQLTVDPMETLGQLAHLKVLKLKDNAYTGSSLRCPAGSFPQLEVLKLINLGVYNWEVSVGSMPNLRTVVIDTCGSLSDLPAKLKELSNLEELQLRRPTVRVINCATKLNNSMIELKRPFKLRISKANC